MAMQATTAGQMERMAEVYLKMYLDPSI